MTTPKSSPYPFFARSDLDGFFGLFVDNLVQLLLIAALCSSLCGMKGDEAYLLLAFVLPGAAVSVLLGNLFYAWQADQLARREKRNDVTALPFGINTPSLLIYIYFVLLPVYRHTGSAKAAWQMGLVACLGSGIIEFLGAFVADAIRRHTPRAALLSSLAGIAIGFISMSFALQIWQHALVAMLPFALILLSYFGGVKYPGRLPGGFLAVLLGTALAWLLPSGFTGLTLSTAEVQTAWQMRTFALPHWAGSDLWEALTAKTGGGWLGFLSVIVPMGVFNVVGSLQNIESAEAAGDKYSTKTSLSVNGACTILAALFGSCFPTTIYIGHPGWKAMGARAGYSSLNGLIITLICFTGTLAFIGAVIPLDACIAIVVWIGIIITAQAFQTTPTAHAPAVALGLFPAIAGLGASIAQGVFFTTSGSGPSMQTVLSGTNLGAVANGFLIHGLNIMSQGYIFTCMILAACCVALIERQFFKAALWCVAASFLTVTGLIHAYQLSGNQIDFLLIGMTPASGASAFPAGNIAIAYLMMALLFVTVHWVRKRE